MADPGIPRADRLPEIDALVDAALDRLPEPFQAALASVAIVVEDEPSPRQLEETGAAGLYGLYQGVPRTRFGAEGAAIPSKITIFAGPLIRANPTPEALAAAVADTVYHEVAHHLGIDDGRLRELARDR